MVNDLSIDTLIERNQITGIAPAPNGKSAKRKTFDLKELLSNRITHKTSFPEPIPVLTINGSTFAVESEVSIITGLPKAGKSAVLTACIASHFAAGRDVDTLSITAPRTGGRNVIYIDTEMSKGSTQKLHNQVLRLLDMNTTPENLHVWNWKKYTPDERLEALKATFEHLPDIQMIYIDGIADFMLSVNDEIKANEVLEWLGQMAESKGVSIVCVIHENFGNGQARGHVGSGLGRKCAGTVSIKKDRAKGITSIECKMLRHAPDFEPVYAQWDIDLKRLALVDSAVAAMLTKESKKTEEEKQEEKADQLKQLLKQCFNTSTTLDKKALKASLCTHTGAVERTALRHIQKALENGLISVDAENMYTLVSDTPF